MTDKNNST